MRFFRKLTVLCLTLAAVPLAADEPSWTPIGPEGGLVRDLATSPALPGWVFASVPDLHNPLFRSANRGRTWTEGSGLNGREITDFALTANGRTVFAATGSGLLRSTDRGATWELIGPGDDQEPAPAYLFVETHPRRPGVVLAYQIEPQQALYRSTDRGNTWTTNPAWPQKILTLAFGPGDLVVATTEETGLWKSTDAGRTWSPIGSRGLPPGAMVVTLAIDPRNPRVLYAGLPVARRSLFKSTDGGATWKPSQRGLAVDGRPVQFVREIVLDRSDPSIVYAAVGSFLFRSLNQGRDWTRLDALPGRLVNDLEPTEYGLLAATPVGLFLSADRGLTWHSRNTGLAIARIADMALGSGEQGPPRLYAAANGRLFRTDDRGAHWRLTNLDEDRFSPRYFNPISLAIFPGEPETVYVSASSTVARSTDGGETWTYFESDCLLVSSLAVDPRDADHLFGSGVLVNGCGGPITQALVYSEDGGETWTPHLGPLTHPLGFDPFDSSFYVQDLDGSLGRLTGGTLEILFPDLDATAFAASPHNPGTLWAGRNDGTVGRSVDGGRTWTFSSTGLPSTHVTELVPDPVDPATIYAGHVFEGVFKSTDAGTTWSPVGIWPDGPLLQGGLLVDPADPSILYAGSGTKGVLTFDQED